MIKDTQKDFAIVKKIIIAKLLELPQGRFPSKRINSFEDIIFQSKGKNV